MNTTIDILKDEPDLVMKTYLKSREDVILFYHWETIKADILHREV